MANWAIEAAKKVPSLRNKYPAGTRIELIAMNDPQAVPAGTLGTVAYVDDIGQIHMNWDNGRTLALIEGVDEFRKVEGK